MRHLVEVELTTIQRPPICSAGHEEVASHWGRLLCRDHPSSRQQSQQGQEELQHYRMLDLLRGLAAFMVVLTHVGFWTGASGTNSALSGPLLAHGDAGVAVFFAISAFLLLRPFVRAALEDVPAPNLRRYVIHRMARILPAYLVVLGAVLLMAGLFPERTGGIGSGLDIIRHLFLLQGYSDDRYQAFSQAWSLSTEATFYVLVPVIGTLLGRAAREARRGWIAVGAAVLAGMALQGVAAAWILEAPGSRAGVLGLSVLGHASWFAVGAAVALLAEIDPDQLPVGMRRWITFGRLNPGVLTLAAALLYLVACTPLTGPIDLRSLSVGQAVAKETLYAAIAGLLLLAATSPVRGALAMAAAGSPAARWIGDTSYPLFLWHVLILQILYVSTGRALFTGQFTWTLIVVVSVSVVLARASVNLLERPVVVQAHRLTRAAEPTGKR